MKDQKWTRDQLTTFAKKLDMDAKERREEADQEWSRGERERASLLRGGADHARYVAGQVRRILAGMTEVEYMVKKLKE